MQIISADRIFTGHDWLENHSVEVHGGTITRLIPTSSIDTDAERQHFNGCFLAPAFIDAQVYGAGGKLLAVYPEAATLQLMQREFAKQGTCLFVPTLATNTIEVFMKGVDAVRQYWQEGGRGVLGLHLEGPWISETKKGAHIKECIHAPALREVKELLAYGRGVIKMITLAPEVCSDEVLELLLSENIIISAGHSNASYQEAFSAFDKGISAVTHLFNAMSAVHHREPGLVGAALNHPSVVASIIPDGHHVDFSAIAIAKKIMGERLFAITDAVTETSSGPYQHQRNGDKYECNGVLSGSALSMHQAFVHLVKDVSIETGEALRMCSLYPARALQCTGTYGAVAPGKAAELVILNDRLELVEAISG